jgi:hypothetical protein
VLWRGDGPVHRWRSVSAVSRLKGGCVLPSSVEIRPVSADNQCGEGGECLGAALTRRILPASEVMSTEDRRIRCVMRGQRELEWVAVIKASGICAHLLNRWIILGRRLRCRSKGLTPTRSRVQSIHTSSITNSAAPF